MNKNLKHFSCIIIGLFAAFTYAAKVIPTPIPPNPFFTTCPVDLPVCYVYGSKIRTIDPFCCADYNDQA